MAVNQHKYTYYYFYDDIQPKGFTNQIVFFIDYLYGLQKIHKLQEENLSCVIFVNCFFDDFMNHKLHTPMSHIIDFPFFKKYFPKFKIVDLHNLPNDFVLLWGKNNNFSQIPIKPDTIFRMIKLKCPLMQLLFPLYDPFHTEQKIFCMYVDHNWYMTPEYNGVFMDMIYDKPSREFCNGINLLDIPECQDIFKQLPFNIKNDPIPMLLQYEKRNIIHLRNEMDALMSWANDKTIFEYECEINQKYMDAIEKYIGKNDNEITIILCARKVDNTIIEWMKHKGYHIYIHPHDETVGREIMAVKDFILATEYCNNTMILCKRSSFSRWLEIRVTNATNCIMISS